MRLLSHRSRKERASALWGRSGKSLVVLAALLAGLAGPSTAGAGGALGNDSSHAFVSPDLAVAATAMPAASFDVIVQGTKDAKTKDVADAVGTIRLTHPGKAKGLERKYDVVNGVSAQLTGDQIKALAKAGKIRAITLDYPVRQSSLSNDQIWPQVVGAASLWDSVTAAPAIAVVDSGVDSTRSAEFGARVVAQQSFVTSGQTNSGGDGYGHGTFVASIAASEAPGHAGAAPGANVVSLDVFDDSGAGTVGDVIAAADWIYQNKDAYGIRVANFSLTGSTDSSFMYDPLDQAVEKLWFGGVVVVAAAGNYGDIAAGIRFSPGNDPFVITVGAADVNGTVDTTDDFAAPWSSHGYTFDGFRKPELGAPGRYLNGAVPTTSTMYVQHPERNVAPGYMWMSGTSFAAPVVAGLAADLLALHPDWTPGQVKGALMLTAKPYADPSAFGLGVGEVSGADAAQVVDPPNPNLALDQFVISDPNGGQIFDATAWSDAAAADPSWMSASWTSASWTSASWTSASWTSASWTSASWTSASWTSASWTSASWTSASWTSASWTSASWTSAAWTSAAWVS